MVVRIVASVRIKIIGWAVLMAVISAGIPLPPPLHAALATIKDIANYAGGDRQQTLEAGARQEARLTVYTTGTQIQPLIDRFRQKYPFIRIQMLRASSVDVAV